MVGHLSGPERPNISFQLLRPFLCLHVSRLGGARAGSTSAQLGFYFSHKSSRATYPTRLGLRPRDPLSGFLISQTWGIGGKLKPEMLVPCRASPNHAKQELAVGSYSHRTSVPDQTCPSLTTWAPTLGSTDQPGTFWGAEAPLDLGPALSSSKQGSMHESAGTRTLQTLRNFTGGESV